MPFVSQIQRQTDYSLFFPSTPIVIDNGGSYFRIGWAGKTDPRVIFRNIVQRPRHKTTGETVTIVGDHDPALLKYFDCTRSGPRSAFDCNVVYQFEIMEYILDFGFDRLGAEGSQAVQIDHPILITECVCNPVHSRSKMAELLFETYGVPSIAYGVDAAFSYKYNQQRGVCNKDGLGICPGFTTTHVVPGLYLLPEKPKTPQTATKFAPKPSQNIPKTPPNAQNSPKPPRKPPQTFHSSLVHPITDDNEMPFVSQMQRLFSPSTPIVIDNGSSYFRIGWAGETDPRVIFRNIVQRPRHKTTGETVTIVGDHDPALPKYFDCTRSGPRSAFDRNVVYLFEIMEYVRLLLLFMGVDIPF